MSATETYDVDIREVDPTSAVARAALRAYLVDVADRYYGRPSTEAEVADALAQHPSDDLVRPGGLFLVATRPDVHDAVGCVGLSVVGPGVGEVRRLHVDASFRGRGLGRALMAAVESHADGLGITTLRLDTRRDLVESQALYRSIGYVSSPPHSGGPYADLWFTKTIGRQ